jgi:hypothetical protein
MGRHTKHADDEPWPPQQRRPLPYPEQRWTPSDHPASSNPYRMPPGDPHRPAVGNFPAVPPSFHRPDLPDPRELPEVDEEPAKDERHIHWLARLPLLPGLAGIAAVGVVAAALSTSQINLNFGSPGAQTSSGQCVATGTCTDRTDDPPTSRGAKRTSVVAVAFGGQPIAGGFRGTATLHNRGSKAIKGWTLKFHVNGANVVGVTGAVLLKTGASPTIRRTSALAPGQTIKLIYTAKGPVVTPTSCTLNGTPCGTDQS